MTSKAKRAVVVHAGARDGYNLSAALHSEGLLEALVTDVYFDPQCKSIGSRALKRIGAPIHKRTNALLPGERVSCSVSAAMAAMAEKGLKRNHWLQRFKDRALAEKALALLNDHDCVLFSYSTYATWSFPALMAARAPRLLFQMHPDPRSLAKLYREELELVPESSLSLLSEMEMQMSSIELNELSAEALNATAIAVASSFTKRTLVEQGVDPTKIEVIPYGVDCSRYRLRPHIERPAGPLRLVFVGSLVQRKGLSYLLEAVSRYSARQVHLTLVTRDYEDFRLLAGYQRDNIEVRRNLTHSELVATLHQSDLFVLPSIAEGFGQVIVEAMATGLPVLATSNTAAQDVVTSGVDGWVIAPRSVDEIQKAIESAFMDLPALRQMGMNAAKTASRLTWSKFHRRVCDFYRKNSVISG